MRIRDPTSLQSSGKVYIPDKFSSYLVFRVLCTSHDNIGWAASDVHSHNKHRKSMEKFLSGGFSERMEKTLLHTK